MSKILVVGNWKMNPATVAEAKSIAKKIKTVSSRLQKTEAVICPPSAFISACAPRLSVRNFFIGAQSVSVESGVGPFTGEISIEMLKSLGIQYIILGHSEQRARGETSAMVSRKMKNALEAGITPVFCVGEMNRDQDGSYLEPLKAQIKESLEGIPKKYAKDIVIAYEPVWAIGAKEA
ncbi:MAG: triose-phosphate isomerase, partial [Candidatus Taylorbacteria bacterium]|nr:triose-phosphate isomerase [Candidatus Taylorbacteria bacterium]